MPIPVACQCGQRFNAPDKLAGKRVKCPKCGGALAIPAPAAQASANDGVGDLLDDAGVEEGRKCPNCQAVISAEAVLCVQCGFDLETRKLIRGSRAAASGHAGEAERLLAKAEAELEDVPVNFDENAYGESSAMGIALVLIAVAVVVVACGVAFFTYMNQMYDEAEKEAEKGKVQARPPITTTRL